MKQKIKKRGHETPGNDLELAHFEHRLRIDKNDLDEELISQSGLFHEICDRLALAISRRDLKKDDLETIEAQLNLDLRQEKDEKGIKYTEPLLKAEVQVHPDRREIFRDLVEAEREVARWQGLKDSFKDRSFCLRELCEMHRDAYFSQNSVQGSDHVRREAESERIRAEMARRRNRGRC